MMKASNINLSGLRLSVAMIVKNEEKLIARALESVRDADEIVIIDNSTDKTAEVVAALNLPQVRFITEYVWRDDFAHARNFSLAQCTGHWALCLDADDWMAPGSIPAIKLAAAFGRGRNTFDCRIEHDGFPGHYYHYPKILRLGAGTRFVGAGHEVLNASDSGPPVATMFAGNSENHTSDPNRALRILTREHASNPEDPRTLYYLAREYWYRQDYDHARPLFEAYVRHSRFLAERADAYLYLARIHWAQSRGDDARTACLNAIAINANFAEALNFMATLSFEHNAIRWREFAALASNENVLFVRK